MKRHLLILFLFLNILGCEKSEIESHPKKLKNCDLGYLLFSDNLRSINNSLIVYPPNSGSNIFSYLYQNNQIVRVNGGLIPIASGSNLSKELLSPLAFDSIVYTGEDIYLHQKMDINGSIIEKDLSPGIFTLDSKKRLNKINRKDAFNMNGYDLFYAYADNQIVETDAVGRIRRKFYFENDNLTKVVSQFANIQGDVTLSEEILFQDYDDKPNPFKNLYYVTGAFYRAFSKNNYTSYTINHFGLLPDGSFGINGTFWGTLQIRYNAENYPMFGDYE